VPEGLAEADERFHEPGDGVWWGESWYFDFATADAALGGYVRIGFYPNQRACWYWAALVGPGRRPVMVVDHEVHVPARPTLEVRHDGLWADHTVEVPFDHVTLGCEAFALAFDGPADAYLPSPVGERVPFGLDLEWDTDGVGYAYPPGATRYEVPCRVHGEVLVGDERIELDAIGQRDHSWGARDWWTLGWTWTSGALDDGTRFHGVALRLGDEPVPYHPGYVQPQGGPLAGVDDTASQAELGAEGLPTVASFTVGDLTLTVEPVAFAPILLTDRLSAAPRVSRFPRALCRFHDPATGRRGTGWTEWNQPQPDLT
jgi:hypothetical protein